MKMKEYNLVLATDDQDMVTVYANAMQEGLEVDGCTVTRSVGFWKGGEREIVHTITVVKQEVVGGKANFMLACIADSYRKIAQQDSVMTYIREVDVCFVQ